MRLPLRLATLAAAACCAGLAAGGTSHGDPNAARIFRLVVSGWDGDSSHACPGGVFLTTASGVTDRNAVTTAGGSFLALRLYGETRRPVYLAWGRRMYYWTTACLLAPNGLV